MRKAFMIIGCLLFVGLLTAEAQRGQGQRGQRLSPEEQAKKQSETFQEELGLSDEQYKKTYDVLLASNKNRAEKMQELRASGDFQAMRTTFQKMQEETDKKLKEIFTDVQWTAYEKWKKENQPQRGRRGGGRGGN